MIQKMLFYRNLNEKIHVDMMQIEQHYEYFENDDIQIVEIPYDNHKYVMGIILPKNNDLINTLIDSIDLDYFNNLINSLSMENILLYLPRFEHKKTIKLVNNLFEPNVQFNFVNNNESFLSNIVHEAIVIVDEDGMAAAAVTAEILLCHAMSAK